jgi:hypothetical protein
MKIIITESQLKRIINEVGGYDDKDVMISHTGILLGDIEFNINKLIDAINSMLQVVNNKEITKDRIINIMKHFMGFIMEIKNEINKYNEEIYLDDDFKNVLVELDGSLDRLFNYLSRMVGNEMKSFNLGSPKNISFGLANDISLNELVSGFIRKIEDTKINVENVLDMFEQLFKRYQNRFYN